MTIEELKPFHKKMSTVMVADFGQTRLFTGFFRIYDEPNKEEALCGVYEKDGLGNYSRVKEFFFNDKITTITEFSEERRFLEDDREF